MLCYLSQKKESLYLLVINGGRSYQSLKYLTIS